MNRASTSSLEPMSSASSLHRSLPSTSGLYVPIASYLPLDCSMSLLPSRPDAPMTRSLFLSDPTNCNALLRYR